MGKVDRTADEIFDDHVQNFNKQQNAANKLQKELNNYIRCVKGELGCFPRDGLLFFFLRVTHVAAGCASAVAAEFHRLQFAGSSFCLVVLVWCLYIIQLHQPPPSLHSILSS